MELIKLTQQNINNEMIKTVNARELHKELGVGRDFSNWIKSRLDTLGSLEGQDYIILKGESLLANSSEQSETPSRGGHNRLEYHITLGVAKHLTMMEKNEIGKKVRDYFIQCEKELREISTKQRCFLEIIEATSQEQILLGLNKLNTEVITPLENKVEEQGAYIEKAKPKVAFHDTVTQSKSTVDIAVAAKLLNFKGVGRNKLFKLLRDFRLLDKHNKPYQRYVSAGWFKLVETSFVHPTTGDNIVT